MHAINGPKHTWKPTSLVDPQEPRRVLSIGSSQVLFSKHSHNSYCKAFDTFDGLALTHCQMIINKICRNAICHHTQCGSDLLVGAMAKLSGAIPPLLKETIIFLHTLGNVCKQLCAHPKPAAEVPLRINGVLHEVAPHKPVVCINPLPPQLLTAGDGATVLGPLALVHGQDYSNILLFTHVKFVIS